MIAPAWNVLYWTTVSKKCWKVAPAVLPAYKKDARVKVTSTTTVSTLGSGMAKCLRGIPTLLITAAPSAPAPWEVDGSAATSSLALTCLRTASRFRSLQMRACSANAWDASTMGKSTTADTLSTWIPAESATALMKEGSSCATRCQTVTCRRSTN